MPIFQYWQAKTTLLSRTDTQLFYVIMSVPQRDSSRYFNGSFKGTIA